MQNFKIFIGSLSTLLFVGFGLLLSKLFNSEIWILLCLILIPFIGFFTYNSKHKKFGVGILLTCIPIFLIAFFVVSVSRIH
ncbi:hypothetical protein [Aureivirga sp. CE67]|uniref:hypothetical protein n=1 Tax=Aureivirga sp. CE67 TaxID=1788983 RepID=UPI0018CA2FFC|nr:hypothetical protein [Aureivirga sp. CE67]